VKVMQRLATTAAALTLGLFSTSSDLLAQTRPGPTADTPKLLVAVFGSNDRTSGVQASDAIRTRVTNAVNVRTLYVIPKEQIDNYLTSSGYKADSALGASDLKELAKLLRADEVLMGTVTRTPTGLRIEPRLALARDPTQAQPLPAIEAANAGDAARQIERSYSEARKQLADNRICENAARDAQYPKAIAAANAAIVKYPNATLARLCMAQTFVNMKASPDSVLRVVDEIRRIDPKNSYVYRLAFQAYTEKGDQERAVNSLVQLLKLEPTNQTLLVQIIAELAKLGKPSVALPIIDDMLTQSPGDPSLIRQKWQLTLAAAAADTGAASRLDLLAKAIAAGESMVQADTALADSAYYARQIAAASGLAQPQKFVEFTSKATQRFPTNKEFWLFRAQAERKAGQLQMAQQSLARLVALDPKYPNANLMAATVFVEMNQPDSAVEVARRAVAAGDDPKTWGPFLLTPTNALFREAQRDKDVPKFRRILTLAQESDRLSPTKESKFFIGVAAYFIANDLLLEKAKPLLDQAQKTEAARPKAALFARACPLLRESADHILLIQTNLPMGGAVEPATAQQILGWTGSVSDYVQQATKAACK
jgi:tetratricopeptide (TPR) repeat protein